MIPVWPLLLLLLSASSRTADASPPLQARSIPNASRRLLRAQSEHSIVLQPRLAAADVLAMARARRFPPRPRRGYRRRPTCSLGRTGSAPTPFHPEEGRGLNGSSAAAADVTPSRPRWAAPCSPTSTYVVTVGLLGTPAVAQPRPCTSTRAARSRGCSAARAPPRYDRPGHVRHVTCSPYPCGSAACRALGAVSSSDKLTLTPAYAVDGFRFGCSHADPLFSALTAGLLGLSGGALSLVGHTAEKAFSYCLPPTERHSGFLTLRDKIGNIDAYYAVRLQGIMVAGRRLHVPPSVFAAGSVVDSGTVITRLPATANRALQAAFSEEMRMYPRVAPTNDFDMCFNLSGAGDVKLPSVALVFEGGATVELDPSGILFGGCLAFYST
ncbi:hypothetical protein BS78_K176200 [Paspalum vaginatum]|uniref:Peptidase A1 domain-containing protein n=1 Tax=Paspalum vaginatum TaxID=158149 RepID=A0A9W8CD59_9POAL|nr:hypothetical protein BS78_K176200 [Paspalum vaginatum]